MAILASLILEAGINRAKNLIPSLLRKLRPKVFAVAGVGATFRLSCGPVT
jgi:hypothetical protein